ncbi:transcription factor E2F6-like [Denticeps clupeoides]|uniref:transcription factor E2F6-like n=1 Tax=Denticeps clupeoides TaxID=299321 RepID=UPI0010A5856F|nr:transcription factor E2F6-like [Denticeps clupeoides]
MKCAVQGCSSRRAAQDLAHAPAKRFFSFPGDPARVKVWLAALREPGRQPAEQLRICEDHFLPEHITPTGISPDAIPLPPYLDGPLPPSGESQFENIEDEEEDDTDDECLSCEDQEETDQQKHSLLNIFPQVTKPKTSKGHYRCDVSLWKLTKRFMELFCMAPDGILDLKEATQKLGTHKRRVYDITNVLFGIDVIQKESANKIKWSSEIPMQCFGGQGSLIGEMLNLKTMEEVLDGLIKDCAYRIFSLTDDKDHAKSAYVTHKDICQIKSLHDQMVIAIIAPEETKLEIPTPTEDCIQMHLKSCMGPINVLTCEPEAALARPGFKGHRQHQGRLSHPGQEQNTHKSNLSQVLIHITYVI